MDLESKKVAIYARVSTEMQAEEEIPITGQIEECQKYFLAINGGEEHEHILYLVSSMVACNPRRVKKSSSNSISGLTFGENSLSDSYFLSNLSPNNFAFLLLACCGSYQISSYSFIVSSHLHQNLSG